MNTELLNLPWQIQVTLASGYAGYMIAYVGLRESHKTIDTAFIALAFGLVATATLWFLSSYAVTTAGAAAFVFTCVAAFLWRKWGIGALHWVYRKADMSWGNDDPTALATLTRSTRFYVTQMGILLDDGTWLTCEDASQFANSPFGPCVIGPTGDIGVYLTDEEKPDGTTKKLKSVRDDHYGDRITYIPASRIRQITFRHRRR